MIGVFFFGAFTGILLVWLIGLGAYVKKSIKPLAEAVRSLSSESKLTEKRLRALERIAERSTTRAPKAQA